MKPELITAWWCTNDIFTDAACDGCKYVDVRRIQTNVCNACIGTFDNKAHLFKRLLEITNEST